MYSKDVVLIAVKTIPVLSLVIAMENWLLFGFWAIENITNWYLCKTVWF